MKIGHLRAIPAPPAYVVVRLKVIGLQLSGRNTGISREEQAEIDSIVADGFSLTTTELSRISADATFWTRKDEKASSR